MSSTPQGKSGFVLGLFLFLQLGAPAFWNVSFSNVLKASGLAAFIPYGFACGAVAAFISPLLVGSLADRRYSPVLLSRWLNLAAALLMALCFLAIDLGWGGWVMLLFMQLHMLCYSPAVSLAMTIGLTSVADPAKDFGPLRMWGTAGWALAGWSVSYILHADQSPISGYASALFFVATALSTYLLPKPAPKAQSHPVSKSWKARLGLDALELLRHPDHRVVFITTALITIPLCAFVPFTPLQLTDLGAKAPTGTMSLGQVSEIGCLLLLSALSLRLRLKWIFVLGMGFGLVRYALFATNLLPWVVSGVALHGACFVFFYVTGQIYLAERLEKGLQARAQALLFMLTNGVGNLLGFLSTGWLLAACTREGTTDWSLFWWLLFGALALVTVYFIFSYQGIGLKARRELACFESLSHRGSEPEV